MNQKLFLTLALLCAVALRAWAQTPSKPTGLVCTLTPGNGTVATLSWTENSNPAATAWQICLNGDEDHLIAANSNPFTLTELTPEKAYTAKVRAYNGSDYSNWSNEVTFTPTNAYTLTVNDGTATNSYVPVYGYYCDDYQKCEFVIPATQLSSMEYGTISQMTFYLSSSASAAWTGTFQVFLKEVEETTISEYYGTDNASVVYEGTLDATGSTMKVVFQNNYTYEGGNLLVGVYQIVDGNYKSAEFYGTNVSGACIQGYYGSSLAGVSANPRDFLPKTTFDYTPGTPPAVLKPTNLAFTLTPGSGTIAELSWTENSECTKWQICLNDDEEHLIDVTENPYTLTNLTPETEHTAKVRAVNANNEISAWSSGVTFTPTNTYTLTVNDGTVENGQVPIYGYEANSITKSQFIIPATSLTSILYGTINKLTFYTTQASISWGNAKFEVYVKEVNNTTFASTTYEDWNSMDKVRNAGTLTVSGNKMEVEFTEGYQYLGGNLMVGFLQTANGNYSSVNWIGTTADDASLSGYSGYSTYVNQNAFLPKTTIAYLPGTAPSVLRPTDLVATNVLDCAATMGWTSTESKWNLRYKAASAEEWTTVENLTEKTYTINGLTENTTYNVQVQAVNGEDVSTWTATTSFTTAYGIPYEQGFNNKLPDRWGHYSGLLDNVQAGTATLTAADLGDSYSWSIYSVAYVPLAWKATQSWLVTAPVALGQASKLSFDLRLHVGPYSSGSAKTNGTDDRFVVLVSDDDGQSWSQLEIWDNDENTDTQVLNDVIGTDYTPVTLNFPAVYKGKSVRVAFYAESTVSNANNYLYIDNVVFDDANRCFEPTALTSSEIASRTATVGWTSDADLFNLQYKAAGDADWTTVNGITATSYGLTGLTPHTVYTFRVQTDCGASQSIWSEEAAFTTSCGIPFTELFASSSKPDDWTSYSVLMSRVLDGSAQLADYVNTGAWGFDSSDHYAHVNLTSHAEKQWLVTPDVVVDVANCQLTFDLLMKGWNQTLPDLSGSDDQFAVLVSTNSGTTWSLLALWNNSGSDRVFNTISSTGEQVALDLSSYMGQTIRLAFYGESTVDNAQNVIRISNVSVNVVSAADAHRPQSLAVSNVTKNSATVTWTADADVTSWNVRYKTRTGSYWYDKTASTNSYTLEKLSAGNYYEVQVQAVSAAGESSWSTLLFLTDFPDASNYCDISYVMKSKNEYGWNGTTIKVIDVTSGVEVASLSLEAGKAEESGTIALCNGRYYKFSWIPKDYYGDCSYSFFDVNGDEFLYADAGKSGQKTDLMTSYKMDCTEVTCHQPKNPKADEVGFYSATVSWEPGDDDQTKWEVVCRTWYETPSATTVGTEVTATSYTFDNLNTDYTYYIYVRGVEGEQKSKWSRCVQVRTKNAKALPTDLLAGAAGFTTAEISWQVNGAETKWNLRYHAQGESTWTVVPDVLTTNGCSLTGLSPNTHYYMQVRAVYDDNSTSSWTPSAKEEFWTADDKAMPSDLELTSWPTQTATIAWLNNGAETKWNVRWRKAAYAEEYYLENFENGLTGWTIYTNGESPLENGWFTYDPDKVDIEAHSGSWVASAWSWYNSTAYDADNWLITPQIPLKGTIKFWVRTNINAPDSYAVLLSTTGNAINDFTVTLKAMAAAPTTNKWTEVSIDLSDYDGQQGYIAIHHVSNDQNYLFIDDAGLYGPETPAGEWQTAIVTEPTKTITDLTLGIKYEVQVQAVYDDESTSDWTDAYEFRTMTFKGDVNGDGMVTITDAALIMDYIAHPWEGFNVEAADVDDNGSVTTTDAVFIMRFILQDFDDE